MDPKPSDLSKEKLKKYISQSSPLISHATIPKPSKRSNDSDPLPPISWRRFSILRDAFPKNIAVTLSGFCKRQFPALHLVSVAELAKPRGNSILIEGGRLESHKEVLDWMLACCQGSGILPFKAIKNQSYWHYAKALEAAQYLVVPELQQNLGERLNAIAARQIHSEDVCIIYSMLPAGHRLRTEAANSIGAAIWEKRLMAYPAYKELRAKFPGFDVDLQTFKATMELISGKHEAEQVKKLRKAERIKMEVAQRLRVMESEKRRKEKYDDDSKRFGRRMR